VIASMDDKVDEVISWHIDNIKLKHTLSKHFFCINTKLYFEASQLLLIISFKMIYIILFPLDHIL